MGAGVYRRIVSGNPNKGRMSNEPKNSDSSLLATNCSSPDGG